MSEPQEQSTAASEGGEEKPLTEGDTVSGSKAPSRSASVTSDKSQVRTNA